MTAKTAMLALLFATACKSDKPAPSAPPVASGALVAAPDAAAVTPDAVASGPTQEAIRALQKETVGGLTLGMTEAQVTAVLGKPKRTRKVDAETIWAWPGLEATFGATGALSHVAVTAPSTAKTARGIAIGSTRADVKAAYGDLAVPELANDPRWFIAGAQTQDAYDGLMFLFADKRMESDELAPTDKVSAILANVTE